MFGLESGKGGGKADFVFDLEKEVEDVDRYQEIVETVEKRTAIIKDLLRKGEKKEAFAKLAIILQAYVAILKVLSRVASKGATK